MKKLWLFSLIFGAALLHATEPWEIKNVPAMYENPGRIKIIPGEVQPLTFHFIAPNSVLSAKSRDKTLPAGEVAVSHGFDIVGKNAHLMRTEITLPQGMEFICSLAGDQPVEQHKRTIKGNFIIDDYICDKVMLQPRGRMSEWRTYKIAVRVPADLPADSKINIVLYHEGKKVAEKSWVFDRVSGFTPAPKLKHLKIGFWDYGMYMLYDAHKELGDFFSRAGANSFFNTIKSDKLTLFGSLHHSVFSDYEKFPNYTPDGKFVRGQLNAWYLRTKTLKECLPHITAKQLAHARELGSGWTGMDYEPTGMEGFIPESIAHFKKEYQVSDAEFEDMRQLLDKKGYLSFHVATPEQRKIINKWNHYQSSLHAEFIKALVTDLKKADPNIKFHNTVMDALPPPDPKGGGVMTDASVQAKYLDMIEPQLYQGYDDIAAKYTISRTAEWKKRINELNPQCILHPLLVVRYAGGKDRNTPKLLRQQTVGAITEGAGGVSYYFIQGFNATDYAELAETVRQLAKYEDYYVFGKRCDADFTIVGAPQRTGYKRQWPQGDREVKNPDWHFTAHAYNGKKLVTLMNLNQQTAMYVKINTAAKLQSFTGVNIRPNGFMTINPGEIAYLIYE